MLNLNVNHSFQLSPPIAILGVPFDNVTGDQTLALIDSMIASRRPHYVVTANVDFVTQAQTDAELRRILLDAHLVLCDGAPLVWASRLLGNPLPERVTGSDTVPRLMELAAEKGHRVFLLGATPDSARQAVENLARKHPRLNIAGHYSPPFGSLLEMDHREIRRRVATARPDLLFVAFGCPKAEKWIAMHYRSLGVPVVMGIGATIDFLAGKVKRAPLWMQRAGLEWLFRVAQEPARLAGRYAKDSWVFGRGICAQLAQLNPDLHPLSADAAPPQAALDPPAEDNCRVARLTGPLRAAAARLFEPLASAAGWSVLDLSAVSSIDSTGVALLLRLQSRLRAEGREIVLAAAGDNVMKALASMNLQNAFLRAPDAASAGRLAETRARENQKALKVPGLDEETAIEWPAEVTAANARLVWARTRKIMSLPAMAPPPVDLSRVNYIDSAGLLLLLRLNQFALRRGKKLAFAGAQPAVREVLRGAKLDQLFLERPELCHLIGDAVPVS